MGIEIGGQNCGDLGVAWLVVDTDLLVLEQFQPLPRPLLVREGAEKVSGIAVHLAAILNAVEIPKRCVEWPCVAEELGSYAYIDGLNHTVCYGPVLRQTGVSALDPPARDFGQPASEDAEDIVQWPQGMKPTPLDPLQQLEDVWSGQQRHYPARNYLNDTAGVCRVTWTGRSGSVRKNPAGAKALLILLPLRHD